MLNHFFQKIKKLPVYLPVFFFLLFPASTNYKLKSYEFGGGGGTANSAGYSIEGIVGQTAGSQTSGTYSVGSGLIFTQNANVPEAPAFVNSSNWYNKLKFTITVSGNPTDAKYAVAISTDNFTTTNYIQSDNTIGAALGAEDFQTYTTWGGASGAFVTGLSPSTTYYIKVKATQGKYTESGWGPSASAATVGSQLSFDIDVSSSDTETASPYEVDMGTLTTGSVNTAADKVWIDFETNGASGGYVYVYDQYNGLRSAVTNYTITSASTDLSSANEGFGIQSATTGQTAGGPLAAQSPYNGAGHNVGIVDTSIRTIYTSSNLPITAGRASFYIKAKPRNTTPASSDYTDSLTLIATAAF